MLQSTILAQAASIEDVILQARFSIIHLRRISNQHCPIMRLPSEILADGIGRLLADEDYPKSLLRLSHVSHHIRKVLLSCPWVWAGGSIKSSWHPNLVTAILEQTGGTPLQVACNFATSRGTKGSGDIVSSVQRWRSAHLSVPSLPEFPASLTRLRSLPAPALEELVVSVPHRPLPTIIPELFSGVAPNLRTVEFHNFSIHHDSLLWRGLHSLHLNIHHMWTVLSPQQMFAILAASPELHTLRLCDRMVGLAQEPEPDPSLNIELPHLSTMELAVVPSMLHVLLTNIKAPACNRLEVTTTFADGSPQPARQVLWSLFKSAAPILARLTSDEEPPTARISVQTSALQLFARRDDWVVNCQLNCGDSGWLTPLFREAAEQCGTRLPVLVDFGWIIFAEDGRNFSEILNCRSLWVRSITVHRTFQSSNLLTWLSQPKACHDGRTEWACPRLETIGGDIPPSSPTVYDMLETRRLQSGRGPRSDVETLCCKEPLPLRSVFFRDLKEGDTPFLPRIARRTKILDWNAAVRNIQNDTQSNWPEPMAPIGSHWR